MYSVMKWQVKFREYISGLNLPRDDYRAIMEYIDEVPVQPETIRCKECKYSSDDEYCHCSKVTWWNGENDFCSRAERRTDE